MQLIMPLDFRELKKSRSFNENSVINQLLYLPYFNLDYAFL
jgi:hypothetical protein